MKRRISLALAACLAAVSIAGCGGTASQTSPSSSAAPAATEAASSEEAKEAVAEEAEAVAEEVTEVAETVAEEAEAATEAAETVAEEAETAVEEATEAAAEEAEAAVEEVVEAAAEETEAAAEEVADAVAEVGAAAEEAADAVAEEAEAVEEKAEEAAAEEAPAEEAVAEEAPAEEAATEEAPAEEAAAEEAPAEEAAEEAPVEEAAAAGPAGYYVQNDGYHFLDIDPLAQENDLGDAIFYLEATNGDLVVLPEGKEDVFTGILSQAIAGEATEATGTELSYGSANLYTDRSGASTAIMLGTGSASLTIAAEEDTTVTLTVESIPNEGEVMAVVSGTADIAAGEAASYDFVLTRAYDDGQGEQAEYAAFKFPAGQMQVVLTSDKPITLTQGEASTVTLPFLYESEMGYNGIATKDGESFNASLYWLYENIYLYNHDTDTWEDVLPADVSYTVNEDGDADFGAFIFRSLGTFKSGKEQIDYEAKGNKLDYPFPTVRKLHVATAPMQGVKDLLYLPTIHALYQDIFMPTEGVEEGDEGNLPVLIYIHGFGGSYSDPRQALAPSSLKKGYAVVGIDLRVYPPNFSPSYYQDINGNVRFLRAHAAEYGLDPDRFGIYGVSLGGNSALMGAVANDNPYTEGEIGGNLDVSSRLQTAVVGYAWTDAINFGADQRTDNANDPALLASMITGGDGESAPCAQAIDWYGPGKGYLMLRVYQEERAAAEEAGTLDEFLSKDWTLTIDDDYIAKWFSNVSANAFIGTSAAATKGTYTYTHKELEDAIAFAHAASPLYHITPDDPIILAFGGYGGRQNITNTQSTRTLKKCDEMGIPALMLGNNLGNYGAEPEIVAAMDEFLDKNLKHHGENGTRMVLTVDSFNAVVNDKDIPYIDALVNENGTLKVRGELLNQYFGTELDEGYLAVDELDIKGVTINTYNYEVFVSNTETEERTSVSFTKNAPNAGAAAPSEVVESTKVSLPGQYAGYYDEDGGEAKTYPQTITRSEYVRVPSHYEEIGTESYSDPDNEDPSYDPETGTIELAVAYVLPSEDGETPAGAFPVITEITRGDFNPASSQYDVDYLVKHGYAYLNISSRGTGDSFGVDISFSSLENRYDIKTIFEEWLPTKEWYDSEAGIGMVGGSNKGLIQWAVATVAPEGLKAISPEVSNPDFYYQDYRNGVSAVPGGSTISAKIDYPASYNNEEAVMSYDDWYAANAEKSMFVDGDEKGEKAYEAYRFYTTKNLRFMTYLLTENVRRDDPIKWLHDEQSNLTIPPVEQWDAILASGIAIDAMGGFDDSNVTAILGAVNAAGGKATMGPWGHGDRGRENETYPESGIYNQTVEKLRFFDSVLKGMDNGYEDEPNYYYYVKNAAKGQEWRFSDTWPIQNADDSVLYLTGEESSEVVSDALKLSGEQSNNGKLTLTRPEEEANAEYKVDLSIVAPFALQNVASIHDADMKEDVDAKGLTFTSAPVSAATEIIGTPYAEVWVSSDNAKDADFVAYLEEVLPDGTSRMITYGTIRASHRATAENAMWDATEGMAGNYHPSLSADVDAALEEGLSEPVLLKFNLEATAYRVQKDSSLRFTVTCASPTNYQHEPYYAVDENGEFVIEEIEGEKGTSYVHKMMDEEDLPVIKLYEGGDHASLIHIPAVDTIYNVQTGSVSFEDGSYSGPAVLYMFEKNWYVYGGGSWTKVENTGDMYTVEDGIAIFDGFTFTTEGTVGDRSAVNGVVTAYNGGKAHTMPFPDHYYLRVDIVANEAGNAQSDQLLYLPASERLDICLYMPDEDTDELPGVPLILYSRGAGGNCFGIDVNLVPMLKEGYAVASLDLRNYPPNESPAFHQDVKGTIRYLRAHAEELGLDPDRFGMYGTSMGGNTTLMEALSGGEEDMEGTVGGNTEVSSRIQAAISGYGWSDAIYFGYDQRQDHDYDYTLWTSMITGGDGENSPCSQAYGFSGPGKGTLALRLYYEAWQEAIANGTEEEFMSEPYTFTIDDEYIEKWFPNQANVSNAYANSSNFATKGTYTYDHAEVQEVIAKAKRASASYFASPDDPAIVVFGGFGGSQNITNTQSVRTQYALQGVGVQCFYFGNTVVGFDDYTRYGNTSACQAGFKLYWENYLKNPKGMKVVLTPDKTVAVVNNVDRAIEEPLTKAEDGTLAIPASVLNAYFGTELEGTLTLDEAKEATGAALTWYEDFNMLVIKA